MFLIDLKSFNDPWNEADHSDSPVLACRKYPRSVNSPCRLSMRSWPHRELVSSSHLTVIMPTREIGHHFCTRQVGCNRLPKGQVFTLNRRFWPHIWFSDPRNILPDALIPNLSGFNTPLDRCSFFFLPLFSRCGVPVIYLHRNPCSEQLFSVIFYLDA